MKKFLLILCVFYSFKNNLLSQGCSDAGFCTISAFKAQQTQKTRDRLSIGSSIGESDQHTFIVTPYLQYDRNIQNFNIQFKLTTNYATGNLGTVWGLGDFFATISYLQKLPKNWSVVYLAGLKINANQPNFKDQFNIGLPMVYQPSIGTTDVIAGLAFKNEHWSFAFGIQQPLTNPNTNEFLPIYYQLSSNPNANSNYNKASLYPSTQYFNRKGDALINANYAHNLGKKFRFQVGALAIFHLGTDYYTDITLPAIPYNRLNNNLAIYNNNFQSPIVGSDGLTLNLTAAFWYKLNNKISFGLLGGAPQIAREVRPDGLTREWAIQPEIIISF